MSKIDKHCVICGDGFSVIPSRAKSAKTCGLVCRGKFIAKGYEDSRAKLNCKTCGKVFSVPKCHKDRRSHCSMKCADGHRNFTMPTGEKSWNWKGGTTVHSGGYLYLTAAGHPCCNSNNYVFEHRLVMEAALREQSPGHPFLFEHNGVEYLRTEISVHHINENRQSNSIENLLACTAAAHRTIHDGREPMKGHVWPDIEGLVPNVPYRLPVDCLTCGTEFLAKRSDVNRGGGKYCTRTCYDGRERKLFNAQFTDLH